MIKDQSGTKVESAAARIVTDPEAIDDRRNP
jgi:hypothetical protein